MNALGNESKSVPFILIVAVKSPHVYPTAVYVVLS
jgi:hypothetical protein